MTRFDHPQWTIAELGHQVVEALSVGYAEPSNGQVRAVPDRRSIRYYTSLGLLDRPLFMRGRTAVYGRRHLHQLVAIKRLQAHGLSLAEIQTKLAGASDRQLAGLARVPQVETERVAKKSERNGFWKAVPEQQPSPSTSPSPSTPTSTRTRTSPSPSPSPSPSTNTSTRSRTTTLQRFQLAPGVSLLVETEHAVTADDAAAIAAAARPLLHQLDNRGLLATK